MTILQNVNDTAATGDVAHDFVINQLLFVSTVTIAFGTIIGLGFQGFRWFRKKSKEDRQKELEQLERKLDVRDEVLKQWGERAIREGAGTHQKHEILIAEINRRIDAMEEQIKMQLQVLLQNQENIKTYLRQSAGAARHAKQRQQQQ